MANIAIVGYGTAGQTAALALSAQHQITVFEQTPSPGPVGAGFLLQPTGVSALASLGLAEAALQYGAPIARLYGLNHRGRCVMDMAYAAGQRGMGMQRHALFSVLHAAMPASVQLCTGRRMVALDAAQGTLTDSAGEQYGTYDLVVIADGSRSALREQLQGVQAHAPIYPWGAWWCLVPAAGWEQTAELAQRYHLARRMAGVLPVGHAPGGEPMLCIYWSMPAEERLASLTSHEVAARLADLWPALSAHLLRHPVVLLTHATYRDVRMRPWFSAKAVCIGDAAHAMSPQLGQGANMALLDAVCLGQALQSAQNLPAGLADWQRQRRKHLWYYQLASRWLTPVFQSNLDSLAYLRDWTLGPLCRLPGVRQLSATLIAGELGLSR